MARLGLFVDARFSSVGVEDRRVSAGEELFGFMRFAAAVGQHFERFILIARETDDPAAGRYELPPGVELRGLPAYPSLRQVPRVLWALPKTARMLWRALGELDVVWISGVNPIGLLLVVLAAMRRRRVVLLIRQDSPQYFRSRLPSRWWAPILLPLRLLDLVFLAISRRVRATVVGGAIARRYGAPRPNLLEMRVILVELDQLAPEPHAGEWRDRIRLLTVGRIEPEKNPRVAIEALSQLEAGQPGRYSLTWVGEGRMSDDLRDAARRVGLDAHLDLRGFVPYGPDLLSLYRDADAFVHTALTEGVPAVLYEAMGSGLPIVATDVGGVREALRDGEAGLLVPPNDADALAAAVRRLGDDPGLRRRLASRALELAAERTIEAESERVARFMTAPDTLVSRH